MSSREEKQHFSGVVTAFCVVLGVMVILLLIGRQSAPEQPTGFYCAERAGGECVMYLRDDIHPGEVCDGR